LLSARIKAPCQANVLLAKMTTFRIGGPAEILAEPRNEEEALELICALQDLGIPWMVLGGGSNILIGDGGIKGSSKENT
jgi:UDP-N-acetylmuramate dehydrogenase